MGDSAAVRYGFEGFELDADGFELRRDGAPVKLEPQVFDVLAVLVRNHGRVVTKEELLDEVWGDRFVSESALTSRLKAARRALGDDGRQQRCIATVLGAVRAPTLVLHRRDDIDASVEEGRYLADRIPGARFIELDGADHFVAVDPDQILDPIEEFVRGLETSAATELALTTLLAVRVREHLDVAWVRQVLREALEQHRGVPATAEGSTVLATFDGPGRAVRCALDLVQKASAANLHLSVGLHTAEVARRGVEVWGEGVAVTEQLADRAPAGEVWVTSSLRDLTAGSGLTFTSRGHVDVPSLGRRLELDAAS